jgi:glycosyltransferase involved in cell wall biosynthesis
MKIAFFNSTAAYFTGGLETYNWEVGRALARRGHSVDILAGEGGPPRHAEVQLLTFPFTPEAHWPRLGSRFRRLMERLSFARHALPALLTGGYDAVIINKPFDFPALWWARRRGLRAQTVFRSGGREFYFGDRRFAGAVDHWLSTSRYNADQVTARYGRAVRVIPNGVDTEHFTPPSAGDRAAARATLGLTDAGLLLASTGRAVGWKGHWLIVEALAALPQVHFLLLGDGPELEPLRARAAALGAAARLHLPGRVPHAELPARLAAADVYAQPSIGEESFGIAVVEAMACGLPALVADNGGLREIVEDDVQGRLLPPGDVAVWRAAIAALAADATLRLRQGAAARARVLERFTWAANAAALEAMLSGGQPVQSPPASTS